MEESSQVKPFRYLVIVGGAVLFVTSSHNLAYLYSTKENTVVADLEEGVTIQPDYSMKPIEVAPEITGEEA
jgi:hypothetical protein